MGAVVLCVSVNEWSLPRLYSWLAFPFVKSRFFPWPSETVRCRGARPKRENFSSPHFVHISRCERLPRGTSKPLLASRPPPNGISLCRSKRVPPPLRAITSSPLLDYPLDPQETRASLPPFREAGSHEDEKTNSTCRSYQQAEESVVWYSPNKADPLETSGRSLQTAFKWTGRNLYRIEDSYHFFLPSSCK